MPSTDNTSETSVTGTVEVKVNGTNGADAATAHNDSEEAPAEASSTPVAPTDSTEIKEGDKKEEDDDDDKQIKARKEALDALNKEYKDVPHGSMTEVVHLDKRWDKNGDEYYIRQKKAAARVRGSDWWEKHILVVIRHFEQYDKERVERTTVEVYSKHLRKILGEVIGYYPGISFHTEHISLTLPVECLYHYLEELRAEAVTLSEDSIQLQHLNILLNFIETQFAKTIEEVKNLRPQNLISFDTLWTLFRPGTITHSKIRGYDRAFKLESYWTVACGQDAGFYQTGSFTDYDGKNYGQRSERLKIPPFAGSTPIAALSFAPLEMRSRKEEILAVLMKRGKRFQTMRGQCYGEYAGVAIADEGGKFSIKSRVMVDGVSFNRFSSNGWEAPEDEAAKELLYWAEDSLSAEEFTAFKAKMAAEKEARVLSEEETLLATNVLRGFSFAEKKWFSLFIENYSEIVWNEASFDRLVLPEDSKMLIRALVSSHLRTENNKFDDIIKGKGRGLVTVLHGSPGVGKTLTAECIAEYTQRPLYVVSSGDLGTSAKNLERELTKILDLSHTWRAILLIDEADVFLEKRSLTDVNRNALVSVFLRLLEYYEGILFLTTNRLSTFDPAFQSRIHMALKYDDLDRHARQRLWKDFLSNLNGGGTDVSEEGYGVLAEYDVNGRQIKNAVKTAESLAAFTGKPLGLEHLQTVLKTQADFAEAFVGSGF